MEVKPDKIIKTPGRPKTWNFDSLKEGEWERIPCKQKDQERKLETARVLCIKNSVDGKKFIASRVTGGVMIERIDTNEKED